MKHTKRKAFTIVELVIVIAVIAILAAVLIPTFASLIEKANLSSDIQAVRQMNMVVAAESVEEKPGDFDALVEILRNADYDVEEGLFPVSKNLHFLWHKTQNEVFLAKIIDDEQVATVVFPENHEVLTFVDYADYTDLLGDEVFDLAYTAIGGVPPVSLNGISLSETSITLEPEETTTLTVIFDPENATNTTVTWSSDDTDVATVEDGVVTAVGEGTATITATAGGQSAACEVTVSAKEDEPTGGGSGTTPDDPAELQISIDPSELTLAFGKTATLTIVGIPEGTEYSVKWKPDKAGVVTVNKSGKVTPVSADEVTVTATVTVDGTEYKPTCKITVKEALSPEEQLVEDLRKGGEIKLDASADITLQTHIGINNNTVLDLNGKTLTLGAASGINVFGELTIKNGTISLADGIYIHVSNNECTGVLNLENVTVKQSGGLSSPIQNHSILNITNCKFYKTGTWRNELVSNSSSGTVNIYGTENKFVADDTVKDISLTETNTATDAVILNSGSINIYGVLTIKTDGEHAFDSIERDGNNAYIKGTINIKDGGSLSISGVTDYYGNTQNVNE